MFNELTVGMKVRTYDKDDWFNEGEITKIKDGIVTVDFGDWIEAWPHDQVKTVNIDFFRRLICVVPGKIIKSFNNCKNNSFTD